MNRPFGLLLCLVLVAACSPRTGQAVSSAATAEPASNTTEWIPRPDGFSDRYALTEMVILSRHNIRSPLSGSGSVLSRITSHEWFPWTSAPSELSLRGGVLETQMGQFFRQWLVDEGLMRDNELPSQGEMRFYANSMQRTIATAQYFSSGFLPIANVEVEHHYYVGTMDPVFNPQLTKVDDAFKERAMKEISGMWGQEGLKDVGRKMASNYTLLENVLDLRDSPAAANDTLSINADDLQIKLEPYKEPAMTGGLKMANSASDALILQYYEEPDEVKAAFGHELTREEWESIAEIKDWYGDVLFTAPSVAVNVAHPLLQTMLSELRTQGRKISFLCGHDSNIASVLAALRAEEYSLPGAIEKKTPIGSKLVIGKWRGKDGGLYAELILVYASPEQLRSTPMLSLQNHPLAYKVSLCGLVPNSDGLYRLDDLESRFIEAINAY